MNKRVSAGFRFLGHELNFHLKLASDRRVNLRKRDRRIAGEYLDGCSITRLAIKYGLTENRISQILVADGARQRKWRKMRPENRKLIFRLFKKGLSKAEIGRQVGVSRERVRQILEKGI
jgi:DNA-binding CsgD family transcriptional regulator